MSTAESTLEVAMRFTIKEIAALARVSKSTVSKALNEQPGVGAKTRDRILQLVDRLDYQPSAMARALVSRRTGNLGFVIPHESALTLDGAYWSTLTTAITREAAFNDCHLLILVPTDKKDIASAYRDAVRRRTIDGLIVAAEDLDSTAVAGLITSEIPFVLIGRSRSLSHWAVDVDNYQGARDMTRYMVERGFRRVAMLAGPEGYHYTGERERGYRTALEEMGIRYQRVAHARYEGAQAKGVVREMVSRWKPDAIFVGAGGDFLLDTLRALRDVHEEAGTLGLSVFDDYAFLDFVTPGVTAVRQPLLEMGRAATRMLLAIVAGRDPDPRELVLPAALVPRESCGETKIVQTKAAK